MQILQINAFGNADVCTLTKAKPRLPENDEVLIRITSAGLNRADCLYREGKHYVKPQHFPARIGYEGAGIVEQCGPNATFKKGERVAAIPCSFNPITEGAFAEYFTISSALLIPTPTSVSDRDAGSFWMAYLTAAGALTPWLSAEDTVVITAASSSVGLAAIAYAKFLGAKVIATTTHAQKVDFLKARGADFVVEIKDYVKTVQAFGRPIRVVFDAVAGPLVNDHIRILQTGGRIIIYGLLDPTPVTPHLGRMIGKHLQIEAFNIATLLLNPQFLQQIVDKITQGMNKGLLPLNIDRYFALSESVSAQRYMESNLQQGKIVILP